MVRGQGGAIVENNYRVCAPNRLAHVQHVPLPIAAHRHWRRLRAWRAVCPHGPLHNEKGVGPGANGTGDKGNDI